MYMRSHLHMTLAVGGTLNPNQPTNKCICISRETATQQNLQSYCKQAFMNNSGGKVIAVLRIEWQLSLEFTIIKHMSQIDGFNVQRR